MNGAMAEMRLRVSGMTCVHCKRKVEQALKAVPGVAETEASFERGTARVVYDPAKLTRDDFVHAIEAAGYGVGGEAGAGRGLRVAARVAATIAAIALVYLVMRRLGGGALAGMLPLAEENMGLGMLFVIGLITSVHCVVMCGGIGLSQCMSAGSPATGKGALMPSFLYNLGRVISYTAVGALVGAAGSAVSFSATAKGVVQAIAGVFMVIMGLNMTGLFPWLARLVPRMPAFAARGLNRRKRSAGPLYVGLINGLMPCGPLQAMQLYALSTGDPVKGALSMLVFSLGTVPLMFGLGALGSLMSRKFTRRAMAAGAVLVVALGLVMLSGGLTLSGVTIAPANAETSASAGQVAQGVQKVRTTLEPGRYAPITVTAGVPVEWTIDAPKGSINGCNNRMILPAYGIEHRFAVGENVIKFTPDKPGTFPYSCWMGMITSTVTVVEPGASAATAAGAAPDDSASSAPDAGQAPDWLAGAAQQGCCGGGAAEADVAGASTPDVVSQSCCGEPAPATDAAPAATRTPEPLPVLPLTGSCCD